MRFGAFSSHSKHKIGAVKMRTFGCDASSSAILNSVSSHDAEFRSKEPLGMIFRKGTADRREEQRTVFRVKSLLKLLIPGQKIKEMSTRRGNNSKKGQKYQNTKAFKNDLYDTSKGTKQINGLIVGGVCAKCREIIEWRKKFKKYKPLTAPKKW